MSKLTLVESNERAPRPNKSLRQAVYDTIDAIGDNATVPQIKQLLPAAHGKHVTRKQLLKCLENARYAGYFIRTPDKKRYSIAPLSHFLERKGDKNPKPKGKKKEAAVIPPKPEPRLDWVALGVCSVASFAMGVLVCLALS